MEKTRRLFKENGFDDYLRVNLEPLGSEWIYGDRSRQLDSREVILRISAVHKDRKALDILSKEVTPAALSMAPGITGGVARFSLHRVEIHSFPGSRSSSLQSTDFVSLLPCEKGRIVY